MACNLSPPELYKYDWRVDLFIEKLQAGHPFRLYDEGTEVVLECSDELVSRIREGEHNRDLVRGPILRSGDRFLRLQELEKTKEFGGRGVGSTTAGEQQQIRKLNFQMDKIRHPKLKTTQPVYVKVEDDVYQIKACKNVAGVPKADFMLVDMKNKPVVFISHKDGGGPTRFQQWSGISDRAGEGIANHDEVKHFINEIRKVFPTGVPPATAIGMKISDIKLKHKAVYGPKFGFARRSIDNVNVVLEGHVVLHEIDTGVYELKAENKHYNGEMLKGDYEPILFVQYRGDRGQFNIPNARFSIHPKGGNKKTVML